jgi:AcrR family transcriptional regulator
MTSVAGSSRSTFRHGDLANALLKEAHRLLQEQGVHGFSLREAARAIGVSPNAAYRHFDDKSVLLAALAKRGFAQMAAVMENAIDRAAQPIDRLRATGEGYLQFAQQEPALFELMFGPFGIGSGQDVAGVGPRTGLSPYELLSRALEELVVSGVLLQERREGAEMLFWPAIHGLAVLNNAGAWKSSLDDAFERMFQMLVPVLGTAITCSRTQ